MLRGKYFPTNMCEGKDNCETRVYKATVEDDKWKEELPDFFKGKWHKDIMTLERIRGINDIKTAEDCLGEENEHCNICMNHFGLRTPSQKDYDGTAENIYATLSSKADCEGYLKKNSMVTGKGVSRFLDEDKGSILEGSFRWMNICDWRTKHGASGRARPDKSDECAGIPPPSGIHGERT